MPENLGCLIYSHVGCYCSCSTDSRCCGCQQPRSKGKYHLHCLVCETDFSSEVDINGGFDMHRFSQDGRLDKARQESCRKLKRSHLQKY